jgi:hypothetical protein
VKRTDPFVRVLEVDPNRLQVEPHVPMKRHNPHGIGLLRAVATTHHADRILERA